MPRAGLFSRTGRASDAAAARKRSEELRAFVQANVAEIDAGYNSPCWRWQRYLRSDGYGETELGGGVGRIRVHRLAYEVFVGPIPDGLTIDHLCRNPSCCNPAHLEPVSRSENSRRAHPEPDANFCPRGHPRTPTSFYKNGNCKKCHAASQARWEERNQERRAEIRRRWRENNREKINESQRRRRAQSAVELAA